MIYDHPLDLLVYGWRMLFAPSSTKRASISSTHG